MTSTGERVALTVAAIGARGDGIIELGSEKIFVPFVLPGEMVEISLEGSRGVLEKVIEPSKDRVEPACAHFGTCGGCSLQHWEKQAYLHWKEEEVRQALAARGFDLAIDPCIPCPPRTRRRATFAVMRTRKTVRLGFFERASHTIVDIGTCPVIADELQDALPKIAKLVEPGLTRKGQASVQVTMTKTGLDVDVTGGKKELDITLRQELAEAASEANLARLSWDGEIVAERRTPTLSFGGIEVALPPGAFLQATREGEAEMIRLVTEAVGDATSVVDLFSGCGTFALSLAKKARVYALEGAAAQCVALEQAVKRHGPAAGLKPFQVEKRDLARRPLAAALFKKYEAVVIDPPRAGAAAQCEELAASDVPTIVSVSCNPATFARDARILVDGGYRLEKVTPLDQFLWSPHIELVGVFKKG